MECKRIASDLACFGSPESPTADIFRTDAEGYEAQYIGGLLQSYKDSTSDTSYGLAYYPSGKLRVASATSLATAPLRQSYEETYVYDAVGNIGSVHEKRNYGGAEWGSHRAETVYAESAAYKILDRPIRTEVTTYAGAAPPPSSVVYGFDVLNRLSAVTRDNNTSKVEHLSYGPYGELLSRRVGEKFWFYVGEFATVTAEGTPGCGPACLPQPVSAVMDAHLIFAGTRIASVRQSRTLYYHRARLGTVVATTVVTSDEVARRGALYRYTPYGVLEAASFNDSVPVSDQESELGYANALRLGGVVEAGADTGRLEENLLHMRARVYDPVRRLFLQADTKDRLRYAYVRGDPVNFVDPLGREAAAPTATVTRSGDVLIITFVVSDDSGTHLEYDVIDLHNPMDLQRSGLGESEGQVLERTFTMNDGGQDVAYTFGYSMTQFSGYVGFWPMNYEQAYRRNAELLSQAGGVRIAAEWILGRPQKLPTQEAGWSAVAVWLAKAPFGAGTLKVYLERGKAAAGWVAASYYAGTRAGLAIGAFFETLEPVHVTPDGAPYSSEKPVLIQSEGEAPSVYGYAVLDYCQ